MHLPTRFLRSVSQRAGRAAGTVREEVDAWRRLWQRHEMRKGRPAGGVSIRVTQGVERSLGGIVQVSEARFARRRSRTTGDGPERGAPYYFPLDPGDYHSLDHLCYKALHEQTNCLHFTLLDHFPVTRCRDIWSSQSLDHSSTVVEVHLCRQCNNDRALGIVVNSLFSSIRARQLDQIRRVSGLQPWRPMIDIIIVPFVASTVELYTR